MTTDSLLLRAGDGPILILFLERKSIKKNFSFALQTIAIPGFLHGNGIALLIKE
ncbi:MAG: hypothetical protein K2N78_05965 [Oscillospiraceae bacterium]|nr:hypothetical protein [Oscillospiraceae bacterium]